MEQPEVAPPPDRAPAAGSQPRVEAPPGPGAEPVAEPLRSRLLHGLTTPTAGLWLAVSGLAVLVFAVGGLITVGLRRRRW